MVCEGCTCCANVWGFLFNYILSHESMTPNFKYSKHIFTWSQLKQVLWRLHVRRASYFFPHWWTQRECTITVFERPSNKRKISSSKSAAKKKKKLWKHMRDLWYNHISLSHNLWVWTFLQIIAARTSEEFQTSLLVADAERSLTLIVLLKWFVFIYFHVR